MSILVLCVCVSVYTLYNFNIYTYLQFILINCGYIQM